MIPKTKSELAAVIDQTNLNPSATRAEIEEFVRNAVKRGFYSVCVLPNMVPVARKITAGTNTKVATVVSFPLGADVPEVKSFEARSCIEMGADEIDMVINVSLARMGRYDEIEAEVRAVREVVGEGQLLKVIIEVPLLNEDQTIGAALAAERGGAHIVKTSTGFKGLKLRATTPEDIRLLHSVLKPETGIKASGGVSTFEKAMAVLEEGATRIGTSSGETIINAFIG